MALEKKLMRNGNGWALSLNSTILGLMDINPETDTVQYIINDNKLTIVKCDKKGVLSKLNEE